MKICPACGLQHQGTQSRCRPCYAKWAREWRKKNVEKATAACKRWRKKNPEKWSRSQREGNWKKTYGITVQQYEAMLKSQNGVCAVCGSEKPDKKRKFFSVDHCHKTNVVRGLLCTNCNFILGHCFDRIDLLESAINYLKKGKG